ncbi:hypothetical protein QFZ77_000094 [Paenibacillus sp. V4I3]|nr:hypothetical protein [Paenibacillus sp. V4I3]MDQ0885251.1 hypothetical protein [Paenibacillus sp. V4I9]
MVGRLSQKVNRLFETATFHKCTNKKDCETIEEARMILESKRVPIALTLDILLHGKK